MAELSLRRNVYAARGDFGFGGFQAPTGSMGMGGGGTLSAILSAATQIIPSLLNRPRTMNATMVPAGFAAPVLAPVARAAARTILPAIAGGAAAGFFGGNGGDELFTASGRPRSSVPIEHDDRLYWFQSQGRPILWSGDLRAAKRVAKVAARAGRVSRRRSLRRRR